MNRQQLPLVDDVQGQATYGMLNLRRERTGLPFIVFISQRDGAQHDARVKVSPEPKMRSNLMGSYSVRPFAYRQSVRMSSHDEDLLRQWIELNRDTLIAYWDSEIEYTEDAVDRLKKLTLT